MGIQLETAYPWIIVSGVPSTAHTGVAREDAAIEERVGVRPPRLFRVILHNDDFTTMEFVVSVLIRHFNKTETEANRIMLQVHHGGYGVAGTYTRDIAETKVGLVMQEARTEGFPLRLSSEPE